jgi:hypothetical protein
MKIRDITVTLFGWDAPTTLSSPALFQLARRRTLICWRNQVLRLEGVHSSGSLPRHVCLREFTHARQSPTK